MVSNNGNDSDFVTIALPRNVINQIDNFVVKTNPKYTSRAHVVKVALDHFFKDHGGGEF